LHLEQLHIAEEIDHLLQGVGWMGVAQIQEPVYREPCIEFLSTLTISYPTRERLYHQIAYQLGGRAFSLSLAEFNVALGFETAESI